MSLNWKETALAVPGIGAALLPKLTCGVCWPAYAALASSFGVGFLTSAEYMLPITLGALTVALGALFYRARQRRGYGPSWLGLLAAGLVYAGGFQWPSDPTMYAGAGLLMIASVWNVWPIKRKIVASCESCAPDPMGAKV